MDLFSLCHGNTQSDITCFGPVTWLNEWQIKADCCVSAHLARPGPGGPRGDQQAAGWVDGWRDRWMEVRRAHCALQMAQGLRRGRSRGEGTEMEWLVIGSSDPDTCSWVPSSTLGRQWRDTFTANEEISCDLSFGHVSFCFKRANKKSLLLLISHGLILTSAYWLDCLRLGLLCCCCFLTANTQISQNIQGKATLLFIYHQTPVEQRRQSVKPK